MSRMSRAIVPLIVVVVSGCANGNSSPIPTAPSSSSYVVQGQGQSGYVGDTVSRSVVGARVEMLDGPQPGMTVLSGSNGLFSFPGTFPGAVTLRASKEGYIALTKTSQTSTRGGRSWANFQPEVLATAWSESCNSGPRIAHARCESKNHRLILTRR
jgi:Carboxypeptidase regulatory-like domain